MEDILQALSLDNASVLRSVLRNAFIVDMGIIKEIKEDSDMVTVEMCCASDTNDIHITNCYLANVSSSSIAVKITPNVNDKVIVFYPRRFSSEMFSLDKTEPVISEGVGCYSSTCGIAFLFNQFQEGYKNYVSLDNGKVDIKLAYDEDNDKNLLTVTTDENGAVTLTSNTDNVISLDKDGNYEVKNANGKVNLNQNGAATVTSNTNNVISLDENGNYEVKNAKGRMKLDNDGYFLYENTDTNNTIKPELKFTSSGFSLKDKNGCTIVSSTVDTVTKTVINGKLTIKK